MILKADDDSFSFKSSVILLDPLTQLGDLILNSAYLAKQSIKEFVLTGVLVKQTLHIAKFSSLTMKWYRSMISLEYVTSDGCW